MEKENLPTNIKFDSKGDQILEETQDGSGKIQTIKYGLIKIVGEKQERRISFKTLLSIYKAKEVDAETIMIRELNMTIKTNQIVMMRSDIEKSKIQDSITKLPTANLILTMGFEISPHLRTWFLRNCVPYYEATVHYLEKDGEREYYLEPEKIKRLLKVEFDEDGYDYISEIYKYGIKEIRSHS